MAYIIVNGLKVRKDVEWSNIGLNPVTGCGHWGKTPYCDIWKVCWAEKRAKMNKGRFGYPKPPDHFKPTIHEDKFKVPKHWKKPRVCATCLMADLFSCGMPDEYIKRVIQMAKDNPRHIFMFLTKAPARASRFTFPDNAWVGTTVNTVIDISRIYQLKNVTCGGRFISFEPIKQHLHMSGESLQDIQWVVIGSQTRPTVHPPREWVDDIIDSADKFQVPVLIKSNSNYEPKRFDYPLTIRMVLEGTPFNEIS